VNRSPGATAGGTTHVPVVTNWPAEIPPAYVESSFASHVSARRGSPNTFAPVPEATRSPLIEAVAACVVRSRWRHPLGAAGPSAYQQAHARSAISCGAPTLTKSL